MAVMRAAWHSADPRRHPPGGSVPGVTTPPGRAARVVGPPGSAAVAAGSAEVVAAATATLVAGGSAVDAAISGGLTAVLSEPVLASLGGGGFLLHAPVDGVPSVLDFFVDVPGLGAVDTRSPHLETVVVDFARTGSAATSSEQVFHGGWGSVAVPGCLTGYLDAHRRWGRLPLDVVVAPAVEYARRGVVLSSGQRVFLHLVSDLLALTPDSRALFAQAEADGRYANPALARLLEEVGAGRITSLSDVAFAGPLVSASEGGGGLLTPRDLADYRAVHREALAWERRGARVFSNPPPSVGGSIVLSALAVLEHDAPGRHPVGSARRGAGGRDRAAARPGPGADRDDARVGRRRRRLVRGADDVERVGLGDRRAGVGRDAQQHARRGGPAAR